MNARRANKGATRSEESKAKMREANLEYRKNNPSQIMARYVKSKSTFAKKSQKEKELIKQKQSTGQLKHWKAYKNTSKCVERNKKLSEANKGNKNSMLKPGAREKSSKSHTGKRHSIETLRLRAKNKQAKVERGEDTGLKSKYYKVGEFSCQGRWEKMYIEFLYVKNLPLPNKRGSFVETPTGIYHPDFEYDKCFIEIKSPYTYSIFNGETLNIDGIYSTEQREKAIWTSKNKKPVKLIVLDQKGNMIKEEVL